MTTLFRACTYQLVVVVLLHGACLMSKIPNPSAIKKENEFGFHTVSLPKNYFIKDLYVGGDIFCEGTNIFNPSKKLTGGKRNKKENFIPLLLG